MRVVSERSGIRQEGDLAIIKRPFFKVITRHGGENLMDLERDLFASVCLAVEAVAAGQFILEKYPRRWGLAIEAAIFGGFGGGCPIN